MNIDIEKTKRDMEKRYVEETEKNVKYFCDKAYMENSSISDIMRCETWLDTLEKLRKNYIKKYGNIAKDDKR